MIADFYFIKKESLNNKDIYSLEQNGSYYYSGGWHIKGVYALFLGFIFSVSTIWNNNLMFLAVLFLDNWSLCLWFVVIIF